MLRIMAIGDVTSPQAAVWLSERLWRIRRRYKIDFVAVNAENAGFIVGPSPEVAEGLLQAGADVLTGGNHILQNFSLYPLLENDARILRPANYPPQAPGIGHTVLDACGYRLLVINLLGRVHMDPPLDSPFTALSHILERQEGKYDLAILDIHAEATGEKLAVAYAADGYVSAVYGTHTHVPTADLRILPAGTGYVTDLGMCGGTDSILGMEKEGVIKRSRDGIPCRFTPAAGPCEADAVIFNLDPHTRRCTALERIKITEED